MIFLREKIAVPAAFLCAATASTLAAPDVPAKEIPPEGSAENVEEISPESTEKFSGARTEYFVPLLVQKSNIFGQGAPFT